MAAQLLSAETPLYVIIVAGTKMGHLVLVELPVTRGLSWKIKFEKINYLFGYYVNLKCQSTNFEFSKIGFSTSSYHISMLITIVFKFT